MKTKSIIPKHLKTPFLRTNLSEAFDIDNFRADSLLETPFWGVRHAHLPATNVREDDNTWMIELAAPGLEKEDFNLDYHNGRLEVKVKKEREEKEETDNYIRREYSYNSFVRAFTLPKNVNEEMIEAKYTDGILKILIPKTTATAALPAREIFVH